MTLYDAYGRPVDIAQLREEQAAPTMTGVRDIYSVMHPSVGLTPRSSAQSCVRPSSGIRSSISSSPKKWKKRICTISRY
jgi:hypothetical protein